jgi:glycerophosphoryl diester phosphodiesterase
MFDLQGHRGARGLWPENTLWGFERAIEMGVCALEFDCAVTRDGIVVVTHDPELSPDGTRDATGDFLVATGPAIRSLSFAQLQSYDVGRLRPASTYARQFPQQAGIDGLRIPRLSEVLSLILARGRGRVRACVEVKTFPGRPQLTPDAADFVRAIRTEVVRTGSGAIVSILAFDWRVLAAATDLLPAAPRVALSEQQPGEDTVMLGSPQPSPWLAELDPNDFAGSMPRLVQASGAQSWGPNYLDLDAQQVAEAHALGLRVVPFTVNERRDMERMLALQVNGMISDRPDILREVLSARGMEIPAGTREFTA